MNRNDTVRRTECIRVDEKDGILRELVGEIKQSYRVLMGDLEGEKKEWDKKKVFEEIMPEFFHLVKDITL